ncbi:MAG TPA: hypothetical protein IAB66_00235 [Candidatus Caccousia avistercoris]|nr:hypothetical protein [Candidatus Caccousia avistercoris]
MTLGAVLFYGGIAGLAATAVLAVIAGVVFRRWSKKILNRLDEEYKEKKLP